MHEGAHQDNHCRSFCIVGGCNIKVLLRLRGGGGKKALEKENKARMLPKQMKLNYKVLPTPQCVED